MMSKYYKTEDVIRAIAEQLCWIARTEYGDKFTTEDWLEEAEDYVSDLPTIEVSEDCISREYIKTLFENNLTGTCKDVVVHTIADAPSVVPSTEQSSMVGEPIRLDFVKKTIEKHIPDALCGIFFTRNFVGDKMTPLDKQFGIDIEICYEYEYFEILGLTDSEQDAIESFYEGLSAENERIEE